MAKRTIQQFSCPHCGKNVRVGAKACPHCGSDDETGWSADDPEYEDDFDYDEFVSREFPQHARKVSRKQRWVAIIILLLLVSMVMGLLPRFF
jgi:uncharacterized membrane protein YvbJ